VDAVIKTPEIKMKKYLFLIFLITTVCFGQSKDPNVIIKNVRDTFKKVKDYSADIDVKVDVSFLKVPEMKAKIYFKQPDKVHIESDGFAMIPKDGLYTSPLFLLDGDYTAIYIRDEFFEGHNTSVVKIIPLNDKGDVVLSTLWIDQSGNQLRKVESTTKTNGTFVIILEYGNNKFPLPASIKFTFNADRLKLSRNSMEEENRSNKKKKSGGSEGKVFLTYSNYVVNKGISDSIFTKKNKSTKN
jgi:outer membrane lipoprotein-sorting protein